MKRLSFRHPEPVIGQDAVPATEDAVMDRAIAHLGWDPAYPGAPPADLPAPACGVLGPTDSARRKLLNDTTMLSVITQY
jgi:hypothetical protein